ncbi:DNA glycosylase [Xylaria longipes]|nr:DNA glycosylase [Xylaria longipes]
MNFSMCTDQPAAANRQALDLSDDFMFGFNIGDDDDKKYLAEVAKYGMGHEDDIKGFVCLSLFRGMEEWEQAICCASAMRNRASFQDPLDGQDILTFLAKIYGVDGPRHTTGVQSPPQRPRRTSAKRKSRKICASPDAEIPLEIPVKKKIRTKKGRDSPYWEETSVLVREEGGRSENPPEADVTTKRKKKAPMKCKGPLEGAGPPQFKAPVEMTADDTTMLAYEGPELTSAFLNDQHESLRSAPFIDTRGLVCQLEGNITGETPGDPSLALTEPKPGTPTIEDLETLQSNIEYEKPSEIANTIVNHTSSDNEQKQPTTQKATPKRKAKSPYFETTKPVPSPPKLSSTKSPNKRPPRGTVSALPFPRLDSPRFGLIQEELATDPFRLLIAVTFLIRTSGKAAIPVFRALMERYPTPRDLADADTADVVAMIKHLGLGAVRAAAIQRHARTWLETPPRNGVRYAVKGYRPDPAEGDVLLHGSDSPTQTTGWEIGHLTQGPYALDSWRIFCRDVLRGAAADWKGGGREGEFQPEWMRVLPADKELRACLRWMWMREGWLWDPVTGEKTLLPDELRRAVQEGRVGYDDTGNLRILDE